MHRMHGRRGPKNMAEAGALKADYIAGTLQIDAVCITTVSIASQRQRL